jgi:imidazolonepropionase-like amidohydrolase
MSNSCFHRHHLLLPFALALGLASSAAAQVSTTPEIQVNHAPHRVYALTNANVFVTPTRLEKAATLVIENGRVRAILDSNQVLPKDAYMIDLAGKTIRPAFIDLASTVATDTSKPCSVTSNLGFAPPQGPPAPGESPAATSGHWNALVCPQRNVAEGLKLDEDQFKALRKLGFGYVLSQPKSGVWRGSAALVSLRSPANANQNVLVAKLAQAAALDTVQGFSGDYPSSTMGAMALLRQSMIDARWHGAALRRWQDNPKSERPEQNSALDALLPVANKEQAMMFFASDELDVMRAQQFASEFDLRLITVGTGAEFRLGEAALAGQKLVLPLNFPEAPKVEDPEIALDLSLAELELWRDAPFNPKLMLDRKAEIALSTAGITKVDEQFLPNLRKAIRYGLSSTQALNALTAAPARFIGQSQIGSLEVGSLASFSIADSDWPSLESGKIYELWIDGEREVFTSIDQAPLAGVWEFSDGASTSERIAFKDDSSANFESKDDTKNTGDGKTEVAKSDTAKGDAKPEATTKVLALKRDGDRLLMQFNQEASKVLNGSTGQIISADLRINRAGDQLQGRWLDANGLAHSIALKRVSQAASKTEDKAEVLIPAAPSAAFPAGEYARRGLPPAQTVVIRNVTAWVTGAPEPKANVDVLIQNGKIAAIGSKLSTLSGALEIDGQGKHISPGLIDAHSHVAAGGNVNEGSHAVTSEVRVSDQTDPTDINIYRELAGGTTTSQVLHGSANPIGGQSNIIKHRWGARADQLIFQNVTPMIKFALGENPKQANWGDNFRTRYPQSRMGVEAILRAQFAQAKTYGSARAKDANVRRDLRLEPLLEILQGKRMVHVHSYRADEILMFVRLSNEFGFKVGAFQHVLEGYKVAPEIAEIGAGASTFADWWAFKLEVQDAIPQNAALMLGQNVNVSLNSDSPDLGRRLNTEAAKAVRFGNLSETQALQMVTINPAKQLRIDQEVGSIEVGKSADLVLWSHKPLSTRARALKVWIDGREYFDLAADQIEQARIASARAELVQLALPERVKAMAKQADAPAKAMMSGLLPVRWDSRKHWPSAWMNARGLYHNGEATHFCTDGE